LTEPLSLDRIAAGMTEPWSPVDVAVANDAVVRLARLEGEFPWHRPVADQPAVTLLLERPDTKQYGNASGASE